ncbi:hypothetical protein ACHHYP_10646 [Achlya hypogyna]|uniref:SLOB protein kinase n=1 Tax=Achlya hypogyna TaxID=1202772 RepID=A0A1V9YKU6_ACHHY|nr:hypothetical protein ACHHYP_10646 [Achlya hypogyna]
MLRPWLDVLEGVAIGLAVCLAALCAYDLVVRCRLRRRKALGRYETSHLLARTDMNWPVIMPDVAQSFLSPIAEEHAGEDADDGETAYGIATREKELCKAFCAASSTFDWLDKPALYMGRNRAKRLYLLGQASGAGPGYTNTYMSSFRKQYVMSIYDGVVPDVALVRDLMAQLALCPQVVPVVDVAVLDAAMPRVAAISPWMNQGSLKDYIVHRSQTMLLSMPYSKKFKRYGIGRPLASSAIARFGRDILLGMQQLHALGIPCVHLHTGNLLIEYEQVRIGGYEALLFQAGRLASPAPAVDDDPLPLRLFAYVLFEMAFGVELTPGRLDQDGRPVLANLHRPSDRVLDVLNTLFDGDPSLSIESLLKMPLFLPRAQRPSKFQRRMMAKSSDPPTPHLTDDMRAYVATCVATFTSTPRQPSATDSLG